MKYWLHERVTLEIATPKKNTVNRGDAEVDDGFRGVTISNVTCSTLLCRQYQLYYTKCK